MLITALARERQQIYQIGRIEGIKESKMETSRVMLSKGMAISLISEITRLSEKQIQQLKSELNSEQSKIR
jgi:predicted transposase YdaD